MDGHQEATGFLRAAVSSNRRKCAQGLSSSWGRSACSVVLVPSFAPLVVAVLKGTCPEVRPDVSCCLLQPVTGARLSPQCFPQSRPTSTTSGWQLAVPGHFSCYSLKVKPRGLTSPVVKRPCNGTAFTNNHWYCHEAESTQRVDSTSSNYEET